MQGIREQPASVELLVALVVLVQPVSVVLLEIRERLALRVAVEPDQLGLQALQGQ